MREFKNIGIIGAGSMGIGIAQVASTAGCKVLLYDNSIDSAKKSLNNLEKILNRLIVKQRITELQKQQILQNIKIVSSLNEFKNVELVRVNTIEESHKLFLEKKVNVLAGLKPKLIEEIEANEEFEMITIPFTFIKQSIGIKKGNPEILDFLNNFISKLIKEGFVEGLLKKHNVQNKLSIPKIV